MKKKNVVIAVIALTITYVLAILLVVFPKKEYSENENRYLATFPKLSVSSIVSGEFTSGVEDYVTDHFPFRNFWISLKSETSILTGQRELNGIYVCEDNYLIQKYNPLENKERITSTFSNFAEKIHEETGNEVKIMLLPTAVTIYEDKLPGLAKSEMTASQLDDIDDIEAGLCAIDCYPALSQATDQIYYRTDHHWTTYGAYIGYVEYCKAYNLTPVDIDSLTKKTVADDFYGTISSKLNRFKEVPDKITIYTNPADKLSIKYYSKYADGQTQDNTAPEGEETSENAASISSEYIESDSLYNFDYLQKKDKYSMFLDGVHPLVEITNENAETDRVLLLVKDSYANSMVPFLTSNYSKIYVLDTRYYKNGAVTFAKNHGDITDVCLLYNMITIDSDNGIRGIF